MKKKLLKAVLLVVVAVIAGANCYYGQEVQTLSELVLANVDALANDEHDRCDVKDCKRVKSGTCYYYGINSGGVISETGEKRPFAYDPYGLI